MKNVFESAKMPNRSEKGFSKFSGKEILSPEFMNRIRGGTEEGGGGIISVPPPPK